MHIPCVVTFILGFLFGVVMDLDNYQKCKNEGNSGVYCLIFK